MKYYGKAEETANGILEAFKKPELLGDSLAYMFLKTGVDKPSNNWSFTNQLLMILKGSTDARTYKQWQKVGRQVKGKGQQIYILAPITRKAEKDEEENVFVAGFKALPVFPYEVTEGDEVPVAEKSKKVLEHLPFLEVAKKWGIEVSAFDGWELLPRGSYVTMGEKHKKIMLGTNSISVWAHEMMHASDDKLGNITNKNGQQLDNEFVAELGACVILKMLGYEKEANLRGCYDYLEAYADENKVKMAPTAIKLINRVCQAVDLILTEQENINA